MLAALPSLADGSSIIVGRSRGLQLGLINPELDPGSDKVFFGEDYPDNAQPISQEKVKFSHPYPAVQDSDHFATDYVKDENSDNGEWKAQMTYDLLRTKITQERDELAKAKYTEEELRQQLEKAKKEEAAAAQAAVEAALRAAKAKEEAKKAQEEADKKADAVAHGTNSEDHGQDHGNDQVSKDGEKETHATGQEESIEKAAAKVKKEMTDLEKCQKELADARSKLKELIAKQDQLHKEKKAADEDRKAETDHEKSELAEEADAAAAKLAQYEAEHDKLHEEEEARARKVAEEEAAHRSAQRIREEEAANLEKMENDMKNAADVLRKYRKDVHLNGGIHQQTRTGAVKSFSGGPLQKGRTALLTTLVVLATVASSIPA